MIIKFENVVTETSVGNVIFQINSNDIIIAEPKETLRDSKHAPPLLQINYYTDGSFCDIMRYFIKIITKNKIFEFEFSDILNRDLNMNLLHVGMLEYVQNLQNNSDFYKKENNATF